MPHATWENDFFFTPLTLVNIKWNIFSLSLDHFWVPIIPWVLRIRCSTCPKLLWLQTLLHRDHLIGKLLVRADVHTWFYDKKPSYKIQWWKRWGLERREKIARDICRELSRLDLECSEPSFFNSARLWTDFLSWYASGFSQCALDIRCHVIL